MRNLNNAAHHDEHSVLVIAATLSIADAVESRPDGPERTPERPAAVRPAAGQPAGQAGTPKKQKRKSRGSNDCTPQKRSKSSLPRPTVPQGNPRAHARWSAFFQKKVFMIQASRSDPGLWPGWSVSSVPYRQYTCRPPHPRDRRNAPRRCRSPSYCGRRSWS